MTNKSDPWSYMIYIGLEYIYSHLVSNNFAIDIAILFFYWAI